MQMLRLTKPFKDESLFSFITRLSQLNYYEKPSIVYNKVASRYLSSNPNMVRAEEIFSKIEELTLINIDKLKEIAFLKLKDNDWSINGNEINGHFITKGGTKVCPLCLLENGYSRVSWEITLFTACPIHKVLLIDKCLKCGKRIYWNREKIDVCDCGAKISLHPVVQLPDEDIFLSKRIEDLITKNNECTLIPEPLQNLKIGEICKILSFIAGQTQNINDATGKFIGSIKENEKLHYILKQGFNIFLNWPINFCNFLDNKSKSCKESPGDTGIKKSFGGFHEIIYEEFFGPAYRPIRDAFETYIKYWDGGYVGKIRLFNCYQSFLSAGEVAAKLNITSASVRKLVNLGMLTGKISSMGSRSLILVEPQSVEAYERLLLNTVSLQDAAKRLGIGHESVIDIIKNGYLDALISPHNEMPYWRVNIDSIDKLLESIDRLAKYRELHRKISFIQCIRHVSPKKITIGKFIHLIMNKIISPCSVGIGIGLQRYQFSREDINDIQANNGQNEYLTVKDVAKSTGMKHEVISFVIDKGLLAAKCFHGTRVKRLVEIAEVKRFKAEFLTGPEVSKLIGLTSPKKLLLFLEKHGINPVCGPTIDGCRQYIYSYNTLKNKQIIQ